SRASSLIDTLLLYFSLFTKGIASSRPFRETGGLSGFFFRFNAVTLLAFRNFVRHIKYHGNTLKSSTYALPGSTLYLSYFMYCTYEVRPSTSNALDHIRFVVRSRCSIRIMLHVTLRQ